ncbi:MAG: VWA domain-containing protein [Deltaproteobacteria bacterium]|nr:VWA domain-containing protein [Deltaproteobacteria bacterium]
MKILTTMTAACIAAAIATASMTAAAQGMLIPKKQSIPALAIESHRVTVKIRDGVAKTTVDQVFRNDCGQQLEATYIFPLPQDASVSDFALWIGGKKQKGEILEKDEARKIYEGIVAKLKDPGLLEYMGSNLFKARIYPVPANGTQKVQIAFTQKLGYHNNMYKYVYPLKTSGPSASTLKDFTFTGKIKSQVPIKTVYSPTHELEVQVEGGNRATVGFEKDKALLDRDLVLYYTVSDDRIGMNLIAHRVDDDDGTFMLLLAPGNDLPSEEIVGKQVTFVVDTSGSMSGEKMQRAKKALKYCLKHLGSDDLFNVIRFSSTTEPFFDTLVSASSKNVDDALERIEDINPLGGTAIEPALRAALKQKTESGVPHFILFITDGMPTVGETDPQKIVDLATKLNGGKNSLFGFGVGDDVNVNFLDKLATQNRGSTEYARTGGDLEMALSMMYAKIAYPALTDVTLEIDGVKTREVFPQEMPDLFYGGQVVVVGRYTGGGKAKIMLSGKMGGKDRTVKYKVKRGR